MFKRNILTLSMVMISFNAFAGAISANNTLTNAGAIMTNTGRTASESSTYSYQLNEANLAYSNCLSSAESNGGSDDGLWGTWFFSTPCKAENDAYNALLNQAIKTPTELEQTTNVGQNVATLVQQNSANMLKDKQVLAKTENSTAFTVGGLVQGTTYSALTSKRSENPNSILTTINQPPSLATKERGVGTKVADSKLSKETLVNRATYMTNFANQASIGQGVINGGTQINNGGMLNLITDNKLYNNNYVSSSISVPLSLNVNNISSGLSVQQLTNNVNSSSSGLSVQQLTNNVNSSVTGSGWSSTNDGTTNNNGSSGSGLTQITCPNGQVVFSISNCDSLTGSNGYIDKISTGISTDFRGLDLNVPLTGLTGLPIFN